MCSVHFGHSVLLLLLHRVVFILFYISFFLVYFLLQRQKRCNRLSTCVSAYLCKHNTKYETEKKKKRQYKTFYTNTYIFFRLASSRFLFCVVFVPSVVSSLLTFNRASFNRSSLYVHKILVFFLNICYNSANFNF